MKYDPVGIIGAGVMGSGLAVTLSAFGYTVLLIDKEPEVLSRAKSRIREGCRMLKLYRSDHPVPDLKTVMERIAFSTEYVGLRDARLVFENITEDWTLKSALYKNVRETIPDDVIFAANTSCIPITHIAACLKSPGRVIGTHFMNPVPLKDMVEMIGGEHTSSGTIEAMKGFLRSIGKESILVSDHPGFVANRLSHLFMNEAALLVQDHGEIPESVDMIFKKGYGHSMGPLETADLIGIDTVVNSLEVLYNNYHDNKFRCCPLLKEMVQAGLLGRKSGQGFFKY